MIKFHCDIENVGVMGPEVRIYLYIGSGAQSEDIKLFEDREILSKEFVLTNEEVRYGHESPKK